MEHGTMVISLDFELIWGVLDREEPLEYKENVLGGREAIPRILSLFDEYGIHATWGVVGMACLDDIDSCREKKPNVLPEYYDESFSPYMKFDKLEQYDRNLLFAKDLIEKISDTDGQEIASHTYSHYYCSEQGQTMDSFEKDLMMAKEAMSAFVSHMSSLILPRNQFNEEYATTIKSAGFQNYRGNEAAWFYSPCERKKYRSFLRRILRLLDNYICISGYNCYDYVEIKDIHGLNNIRSSRFLRPYSRRLAFLEPIRIKRIKGQMRYAATHGKVFHLWWHPHNFGRNIEENIDVLTQILQYYRYLNSKFDMESRSMKEVGEAI